MKHRLIGIMTATVAAAALLGVAAVGQTSREAASVTDVKVPAKVGDFRLVDQNSIAHDLYYHKNAPAVVIVSQVNGSPFVHDLVPALNALKAKYADKGVVFYMMNSTPVNDEIAVKQEAEKIGIDMPVLIDDAQLIGENLGISHVGEAFVIDPKGWKVAYHGPIDDRFSGRSAKPKAAVKTAYLADTLDSLLAGEGVQVSTAKLESPSIAFPQRDHQADFVKISYANDVAPILQKNCVACHSEGGIAPFAMDSYQKVKGFAPMIREVIRNDRMPPYNADPHIGKFSGDLNLSNKDGQTLVHWIEAGAARGDSAIDPLKASAKPAPEWPLGKPDFIITLPPFKVPASGVVDYQYPKVANELKEDHWLRATTVIAGDRQAVHHLLSNGVGSYAVGAESVVFQKGSGSWVEPGTPFQFQMHYTPYGKETTDVTRVGLYFYPKDAPPTIVRRSAVIANINIDIPAGKAHHKEVAYLDFPEDATIYSIFPHAHYRGENAHIYLQKPGGKEELILSLPQYDFNWQRFYDFAAPIKVPKGSRIVTRYEYDNSPNNLANPDPTREITWGEQSFDEMQYTAIAFRWDDETVANQKPEYMTELNSGRMMGILDTNIDGKVEKSEVRGRMSKMLLANFDKLDANKDGALEAPELAVVSKMMGRRAQKDASEQDLH